MSIQIDWSEKLESSLKDQSAVIGVVGLGYVGLPLALSFASEGFSTCGFDTDSSKLDSLSSGLSHIKDVSDFEIESAIESGNILFSAQPDRLATFDVIFVCVPTPVTENKEPDTSFLVSAATTISEYIRPGQLIILKSTTYPGTTEEVVLPILAEKANDNGLRVGFDYFLSFSPERVDPGNTTYNIKNTPVVVGGITEACTHLSKVALGAVTKEVVPVSNPRTGEMAKLLENIYRSVNIALVNELAQLCDRMGGISMWEVIDAAASKPFGYMPFYPGPGLGGHCIPIDPYYLSWVARKYDFETSFITLSAQTNQEMPYYVVNAIIKAAFGLADSPGELSLLVLGVAFKKDVGDVRHSPAEKVINILLEQGFENVQYSDPFVPELTISRPASSLSLTSCDLTEEEIEKHDVVVLMTDHSAFPYAQIASKAKRIVDTRNAFKNIPIASGKVTLIGGGESKQ